MGSTIEEIRFPLLIPLHRQGMHRSKEIENL